MRATFITASLAALAGVALAASPALAADMYGPGVTNTQITIGQTMPYSGPASAYGTIGRADEAYFAMVNAEGGINGRKIKLISLDDGYSPPRTVEQMRKLVEEDHVLLDFNSLGTPTNTAIHRYMNDNKVPQLFVATGATKWGNPKEFPWTMGWQPSYQLEGQIYAHYILATTPNAKIGILYQDDDYGKDYLKGMVDGLGSKAKTMIVNEQSYETSDPTVDSQIIALKASGANVFFNVTIPSFAAKAIKKAYDIGWHPTQYLNNVSASYAEVLKPAGLKASTGIISSAFLMDPTDPQWHHTKEYKEWLAWMHKYYPHGDLNDVFNGYGYSVSATMAHVLKQCGNDLTRANVMKQAANIHDFRAPMLLPGILVNTSPTNFYPVHQLQLEKFNGKRWVLFGKIMS